MPGEAGIGRWLRSKKPNRRTPNRLPPDALAEGQSYLLQVSSGAYISIFKGVDEDLYAFSILRYQEDGSLRWLEARYLVGDFYAFPAFDEAYNPLVDFWYALGASVGQYLPQQWFRMFEEASRKEREDAYDDEDKSRREEEEEEEAECRQDNRVVAHISSSVSEKNLSTRRKEVMTTTERKQITRSATSASCRERPAAAQVLFSGQRARRANTTTTVA
ncbi:hypothetical protein BDB00DRAFT_847105 [Zychaea mexicana]|uniref:uncharacterized protein n=1 Tax=Zychaea mexicana TaxID=64656 RepID=UPI0022FEBFAA|nr:uncharacterized protein BDB00DRAFT_847105 [Zychaea mexicana]KAI9488722.1 hypothetical protein BDB00DRAFT_847105 [Zychaea mexicana]